MILHGLLNCIFVSIPEELYIVMLSLILLRKFEYLNFKSKSNIFLISIPVICSAAISNVMRVCSIDLNISSSILLLTMAIFICFTYRLKRVKEIMQLFFAIALGSITIAVLENLYIPMILYTTGKSIGYFHESVLLTFILGIPERVIEFFFVFYIIVNKFKFQKVNPFSMIIKNKVYSVVAFVITFMNVAVLIGITQFIGYNKILSGFSFGMQLGILLCACMFPIINITLFWTILYYNKSKHMYEEFIRKNKTKTLIDSIKFTVYNNPSKYDTIEILEKMKESIDQEDVS